ncbi:hypothetical protein DNFV4_02248 [Nitrospira tepida]|uniref:Fibronectin type-III domain-containing protein n=1 Tax=Nitrospira tepida TaxID=2973512 RepID=A0AA86MZG7_9BACT|nr:fibronectin type III domain-containing protein [Nitrospira tepida]CAI4031827.1 hypothetical protein DNFV4_02248 [Nitrospira tepida]
MLFQALWLYREWWRLYLLLVLTIGTQVLFASESRAFSLSPSQLTFTATAGAGAPASQTLSLTASGSNEYQCESNASWLKLSTNYGVLSGESAQISVSVNTSGMSAGIYTAQVQFWVYGGQDPNTYTPAITVTLNLTSGSGSGSSTNPMISITPTNLNFSGTVGGSNPSAQRINLTNPGGGTLSWNIASSEPWLLVTPLSGTTTTEADRPTVTANISGLAAGTYNGVLTVSGNASNSPQQIPVTLTLGSGPSPTQPPPTTSGLSANPPSIMISVPEGTTDQQLFSFDISSSGTSTGWTINDPAYWMLRDPTSGTTPSKVYGYVFPGGLAVGTYTATFVITPSNSTLSPLSVPVTLTVGNGGSASQSPILTVNPTSLNFSYSSGNQSSISQALNISNTGGGTLSWTLSESASWLSASPRSGTGSGTSTITVAGGLAAGTYTTNITVSASGASGSPRTIPVTVTVGATSTSVNLSWDANSESDLASYKVYYGTSPGNYTTNINVGKVTNYTVNGLATGRTYYFAVTALDNAGNESGFSNEASAQR